MINKLINTFANYTRSLEILYLLDGLKRAVRLDADDIELKKIRDFCYENGLYTEVSDFKLVKIKDKGKGNYANIVRKMPANHTFGLRHIYVSKDKNRAKFLKIAENKNDDGAIGSILDYPECCVDFFIENKNKQQKLQNDYILPALKKSDGFEFPFYTNYAVRYFDAALLSHFPCNFKCRESINTAKRNFELIKEESKELAIRFEKMLKNPVLYTEHQGVFVFKNYNLNKNILEYNGVLSTTNNQLLDLLKENKKIEIIDKNKIKIEDKVLDGVGFMVFT